MPAGACYWVNEGMLTDKLYNADVNRDGMIDHICFSVKDKFLHPNHPIGWVRKITIHIDAQPVDPEKVCFVLRGQWIPLKHMRTIRDIWWHMLEDAWLYIEHDGLLVGSPHELKCQIDISLLVHTENLDDANIFSCLNCKLSECVVVEEEILS